MSQLATQVQPNLPLFRGSLIGHRISGSASPCYCSDAMTRLLNGCNAPYLAVAWRRPTGRHNVIFS